MRKLYPAKVAARSQGFSAFSRSSVVDSMPWPISARAFRCTSASCVVSRPPSPVVMFLVGKKEKQPSP